MSHTTQFSDPDALKYSAQEALDDAYGKHRYSVESVENAKIFPSSVSGENLVNADVTAKKVVDELSPKLTGEFNHNASVNTPASPSNFSTSTIPPISPSTNGSIDSVHYPTLSSPSTISSLPSKSNSHSHSTSSHRRSSSRYSSFDFNSYITNILTWKSPIKTGSIFGGLIALLTIIKTVNFFSLLFKGLYILFGLSVSIEWISQKIFGSKRGVATSFRPLNYKSINPKLVESIVNSIVELINVIFVETQKVFFVESLPKTFFAFLSSFIIYQFSKIFSLWTILFTSIVLAFALPPVYVKFQKEIDEQIENIKKILSKKSDEVSSTLNKHIGTVKSQATDAYYKHAHKYVAPYVSKPTNKPTTSASTPSVSKPSTSTTSFPDTPTGVPSTKASVEEKLSSLETPSTNPFHKNIAAEYAAAQENY